VTGVPVPCRFGDKWSEICRSDICNGSGESAHIYIYLFAIENAFLTIWYQMCGKEVDKHGFNLFLLEWFLTMKKKVYYSLQKQNHNIKK
jgi:hypothetical protein